MLPVQAFFFPMVGCQRKYMCFRSCGNTGFPMRFFIFHLNQSVSTHSLSYLKRSPSMGRSLSTSLPSVGQKNSSSQAPKTACNQFWRVKMTGRSWKARKRLTEALRSFNPPIRERSELPNSHITQFPPRPAKRVLPLAIYPQLFGWTVVDKGTYQQRHNLPI